MPDLVNIRDGNGLGGPRAGPGLNFQAHGPHEPKDFLCIVRGQLSTGGSKLICIEQMSVNHDFMRLYNNGL